MRPLCKCGERPRAVNYHKANKTYYRSLCETCMSKGFRSGIPRWKIAGYTVKSECEKCGFKSRSSAIFKVFHVDGNLNNCRPSNLKTICSNCAIITSKDSSGWRQGDLIADF
jgi:hypothetical protein